MVNFLVVRVAPYSYNAIINWPILNKLKAITFTYHLKVKFLNAQGIGKIREEQANSQLAHKCYT